MPQYHVCQGMPAFHDHRTAVTFQARIKLRAQIWTYIKGAITRHCSPSDFVKKYFYESKKVRCVYCCLVAKFPRQSEGCPPCKISISQSEYYLNAVIPRVMETPIHKAKVRDERAPEVRSAQYSCGEISRNIKRSRLLHPLHGVLLDEDNILLSSYKLHTSSNTPVALPKDPSHTDL